MAYPYIRYTTPKNGSAPVPVIQTQLGVSIVLMIEDQRIQIPDPVTGTPEDPVAGLVASNEYSGQLVIRAYDDNQIHRGTTNQNPQPIYPAGLYLESGQLNALSKFAVPYSVVQARIRNGGTIRVFSRSLTPHTGFATGAQLYKNGMLQTGVTTVPANDGALWASWEPAAVPTSI